LTTITDYYIVGKRQAVAVFLMSFEVHDVERKILSILKVLHRLNKPAGGRIIAQRLKDHGIALSERAVRYHLRLMDERGLTRLVSGRDGRIITARGLAEIKSALVKDKVGYAITKIELLAFRTNFDYQKRCGSVPVNIAFFAESAFPKALGTMRPVFASPYCPSQLVAVAGPGRQVGDIAVPQGQVGLMTVCSIVINGALLKAGIPMDSRFSGILQTDSNIPSRFTEIIHYNGCSLDPTEIFIKARMTSVLEAVSGGAGEVLANFREVPALCLPVVEKTLAGLESARIRGILVKGVTSEPVCEVSVDPNKVGLVLAGGLNPVAAAQEAGFEVETHSMSAVVDYQELFDFEELIKQ
jgi:repressor of nif and glnA expression